MNILKTLKNLSPKTKETITTLFISFLLFPYFFKLDMFTKDDTFPDTFFNVFMVITALFIYTYYFIYCVKNKYISIPYIIYFVFKAYVFFNSWIQWGFSKDPLINFIIPVTLLAIVDCYAHKNPKELVCSLLIFFEILLLVNFIFMMRTPNWLVYGVHILGNRNGLDTYFFLAFTFALILKEYGGSKLHFYILLPICLVSAFIGKSTSGFLALGLYCLLFFTKLYKSKYITLTGSIIAHVVLFFAVVVFRVQNYMNPIWKLFGKNSTFSSRTEIWDMVLEHLPEKLLFGFGRITEDFQNVLFNSYSSAHNFVLEILAEGGLVGGLIIVAFFVMIIIQMKNYRENIMVKYMLLGLIPLMLHALVESSVSSLHFLLPIMLSHSREFSEYKKQKINDSDLSLQSVQK